MHRYRLSVKIQFVNAFLIVLKTAPTKTRHMYKAEHLLQRHTIQTFFQDLSKLSRSFFHSVSTEFRAINSDCHCQRARLYHIGVFVCAHTYIVYAYTEKNYASKMLVRWLARTAAHIARCCEPAAEVKRGIPLFRALMRIRFLIVHVTISSTSGREPVSTNKQTRG